VVRRLVVWTLLSLSLAVPLRLGSSSQSENRVNSIAGLAASMRPGTWAQLETVGLPAVMIPPIGSGSILEYTDRIVWDPLHTRMVVMGGAHTGNTNYSIEWQDDQWGWYDAGTNTWVGQSPSKATCTASSTADGCNNGLPQFRISHSYEHMTVDTSTGDIYYRLYFSPQVMKWTFATQTWSMLPIIPPALQGYIQVAGALVYFPERGSLIFVNAQDSHNYTTNQDYLGIYEFNIASQTWTKPSGGTLVTDSPYQNVASYGPACHCILVSGYDKLYTYNQDGTVSTKANSAINLRVAASGSESVNTVDPVSGLFLFLDTTGVAWQYNATTDAWTQTGIATPSAVVSGNLDEVVAGPVSNYGVVMFVRFISNSSSGVVYLYKHRQN